MAVENGKHGITANALALGLMANVGGTVNEGVQRLLKGVPVGRLGEPEEVGLAAAWLASDGGGFVTGQVIHLNGGSTFGGSARMAGPTIVGMEHGPLQATSDGGIVHVVIDHPRPTFWTGHCSRGSAVCSTTSKVTLRSGSSFSAAPTRIFS